MKKLINRHIPKTTYTQTSLPPNQECYMPLLRKNCVIFLHDLRTQISTPTYWPDFLSSIPTSRNSVFQEALISSRSSFPFLKPLYLTYPKAPCNPPCPPNITSLRHHLQGTSSLRYISIFSLDLFNLFSNAHIFSSFPTKCTIA